MSSLPPEIITNLLFRLPIKSLLRFRSVSKPWCAEIDSPDFIKLHLTHSIASGSNLSPIARYYGDIYFLDPESLEKLTKIETPYDPHKFILSNTCNGLLLLRSNDANQCKSHSRRFLVLFNPSTRKHLVLPTPPPHCKSDNVGGVRASDCLGYDVENDDYKVFDILELFDQALRRVACEARVYSLKSNSWHITRDFAKGITYEHCFEVYVNGALHTVNCEYPPSIVALDVGKETFNLILMPDFKDKNGYLYTPHVFDGCLALLCRYPGDRTDIWVMKDYGVKESWSMLLSVKPEIASTYVMPMVYSKSRTEVLLSFDSLELVWYDLRKRSLNYFMGFGLPFAFGPMVCVESLVSVGDGKNGEKQQQQQQHGGEKKKEEMEKKKR